MSAGGESGKTGGMVSRQPSWSADFAAAAAWSCDSASDYRSTDCLYTHSTDTDQSGCCCDHGGRSPSAADDGNELGATACIATAAVAASAHSHTGYHSTGAASDHSGAKVHLQLDCEHGTDDCHGRYSWFSSSATDLASVQS